MRPRSNDGFEAAGTPTSTDACRRHASATTPRHHRTRCRATDLRALNQGGGYDTSMRARWPRRAGPRRQPRQRAQLRPLRRLVVGEIARRDIEYSSGSTDDDRATDRDEVDVILRRMGRRRSVEAEATDRRGLFRRR
jgi:hypothetical protein